MPRPRPAHALLVLVSMLGMGAAQAQSLQELYDAAIGYDATYLAARALADSAPYRARQAYALKRPSLGLGASATHNLINPPSTAGNPSGSTVGSSSVAATLSARQPLYNRTSDALIAQADKLLEVSRWDLETASQDLIVRVSQAYFDVLAAQDTLATTQTSKRAISEQLASARRAFEVGTATITDAREAQARFDLATAQEIAAENDLRVKRIALDQLVGRSNVQPRALAQPVVLPPVQPADAEAWVMNAQTQHPAVQRAQLAFDIAQLETERARAARSPVVDLVGSAGSVHARGRGAQLPGTTHQAQVGVQLSMPIFDGGLTQNRIQETLALEERARNDLEAARRAVSQTTRQAYSSVQSLQAQVQALEAAEASSKLALEATQLGYRVGVRVNLDVLNAQTQLFQTQRDLAAARYAVLLGNLRLRQAAGLLTPAELQAISALLAR
jgi:outer membrane protein